MSQSLYGIHQYINIFSAYSPTYKTAEVNLKYNESIISAKNATLSIDKLHLDLSLPIFLFDNSVNAYCVRFWYNNIFSDLTPISFLPNSNIINSDPYYYGVWTISNWIYMVNKTISDAFTNLGTHVILPAGSAPPFFTYNYESKILTLQAQKAYYDYYNTPSPIRMYMNTRLWTYFNGFPIYTPDYQNLRTFNSPSQTDCYFLFYDIKNNTSVYNGSDYYNMISDVGDELISSWFQAKGIFITSNCLKARSEIMPNNDNNVNLTQTVSLPVIYHYNFNYKNGNRPIFVDTNTGGPYKIIDIEKTENLKQIDLQVYWFDKYGGSYKLYLNCGESLNITLLLQEKI